MQIDHRIGILKAGVSSLSPSLWLRANARNASFKNPCTVVNLHYQLRWFQTKVLYTTPLPTQHHSLFRNYSLSVQWKKALDNKGRWDENLNLLSLATAKV